MPKVVLALLFVVNAVIYEPQMTIGWVGRQAQTLASKINYDLDINRLLPQFAQFGKR